MKRVAYEVVIDGKVGVFMDQPPAFSTSREPSALPKREHSSRTQWAADSRAPAPLP